MAQLKKTQAVYFLQILFLSNFFIYFNSQVVFNRDSVFMTCNNQIADDIKIILTTALIFVFESYSSEIIEF